MLVRFLYAARRTAGPATLGLLLGVLGACAPAPGAPQGSGGDTRPGRPQSQSARTITWTPANPAAGQTVTLTLGGVPGSTISWSATPPSAGLTSSWPSPTGVTTTAVFDSATATGYTVTARDQTPGVAATVSWNTISVGAPAVPTGSISCVPASPVTGQSVTCTGTVAPVSGAMSTYTWSLPGGTPASSSGSASATTTWSTTGTRLVQLTATNTYGKTTVFSQSVTVGASGPNILFRWEVGASNNPTPTFTRASIATYIAADSLLHTAVAGRMRDSATVADGTRVLLLEPGTTNQWTYSEQLTNAAWTATALNAIACTGTPSPSGGSNVCTLVPTTTSAAHSLARPATGVTSGSQQSIVSFFARQSGYRYLGVRWAGMTPSNTDGVVDLGTSAAPACTMASSAYVATITRRLKNGWCAVSLVANNGTGTTAARVTFYPLATTAIGTAFAGNGTSGVQLWGAQLEANPVYAYATSYVPTTTAAASRANETMSFPITFAPQAMTALWAASDPGGVFGRLHASGFSIGAPRDTPNQEYFTAGPSINAAGMGFAQHADVNGSVTARGGATPAAVPHIDAWAQMNSDGSVQADARVPGVSGTPGSTSATFAFRGAWDGNTLTFGDGYVLYSVAVRKLVIVSGAASLDLMRTY